METRIAVDLHGVLHLLLEKQAGPMIPKGS